MSMSVASMTGAMAAMAEPPQMPVPALMRLLVFQLRPRALPMSAPRPKQVASVKTMTVSENLPTVSTVRMFRLAPSRMMANFRIFLDVKRMPGAVAAVGFRTAFTSIPRNRAMTDAPMKWSPACSSRPSRSLATAASARASAAPGMSFAAVFMGIPPNLSNCLFILAPGYDKIKA